MWELDYKKAECQKIDALELWCWRRLLRVPWTARRSNQSILKELSPECSLEGLMLRLKYLPPMWRTDSFEKTLILRKIEGGRRRGRQRMRWLDGITDWKDMSVSEFQELVMTAAWHAAVHRVTGSHTWLTHWTVPNRTEKMKKAKAHKNRTKEGPRTRVRTSCKTTGLLASPIYIG